MKLELRWVMDVQKFATLINDLLDKTSSGKMSWETTGLKNVFQTNFPQYSIAVGQESHYSDEIGDYLVVFLEIRDSKGEVVDHVSDNVDDPIYRTLYKLYQEARRVAKGADQAIDYLLSQLERSA
jgi:hypothetical protein